VSWIIKGPKQILSSFQWLSAVPFDSLRDMDVVAFSAIDGDMERRIGAIQEDGKLSPLSAWSNDPVYGTSVEFLVDEEDRFPGLEADDVIVHEVIEDINYGSRQVGGGKGPGNPHGEESELLYYVEQQLLESVSYKVNPDLEILW